MNNTEAIADAALKALTHPLVLKAAWMRVEDWYRSGNLAPEPELSRWRLHPETELRKLGSALRAGVWRPACWPQIPYPKKGACLRHYVMPTVGDQVAFMSYLVLLGPLLDSRVPNFVFGNRWNRNIAWDRRRVKPQWVLRPYQLLSRKAYLPYARSHGLFRRVAHWTVARMTGAKIEQEDYGGFVQHPDDHDSAYLPPWTRSNWWPPQSSGVYWATLDIELAYPSIRLGRLRDALVAMVHEPRSIAQLAELHAGYPKPILDVLADEQAVIQIAGLLMDALEEVHIDAGPIPTDGWRPWCPIHSMGDLPPEKDPGLPTGLAVSGILLNVALHPVDRRIRQYLHDYRHGAIVRFADETIVMSRSANDLFDLIEAVWRGLSQNESALLASPETESNLHLNWSKIEPTAIKDFVACFLEKHGWKKCPECQRLCHPSLPKEEALTLGEWWNHHHRNDDPSFARISAAIVRSTIGPGEIGPFVTTLVARMSEIGRDTLAERFGEWARERLIRLHELARFDIDDVQVRSDTRRAFAANRLVRAWLPPETSRLDIANIRDSIAYVLRSTPWKFSLWHAVVRAAARRPDPSSPDDDRAAEDWLKDQLRLISFQPDKRRIEAWMNTWPEADGDDLRARDRTWRALYLSFHRAAFWHALADALRSLWRHSDEAERRAVGYAGPAPSRWTVRAIPHGTHAHVRKHLGALDHWVDMLYAGSDVCDLRKWPWELDQLVAAVIASASRCDLAEAWRHAADSDDALMVPEAPLWNIIPQTRRILERSERVRRHTPDHAISLSTLAQLWLGGQDGGLGTVLFPRDKPVRIAEALDEPGRTVAAGIALGCSSSIGATSASALSPHIDDAPKRFRDDGLALWEYHRARRIVLGQPAEMR